MKQKSILFSLYNLRNNIKLSDFMKELSYVYAVFTAYYAFIDMIKYGGLEQVGSIGSTLPSSDTRITTSPGDIVLYSSNQIVIFYDSNVWSYIKLGHINLSKSELSNLLGDEDVVITLSLE